MGQAPYRQPPKVKTFSGSCRVCGYPKAWHKEDVNGVWSLNAETRASVGNRVPPTCGVSKDGRTNLYHPGLFVGRRVA